LLTGPPPAAAWGAEPRHQKQRADGDEKDRRHQAKHTCIQACGKPNGGNEQPMTTKESESPAASAAGAKRCSLAARRA
jgi:hypothetical protein